MRTQTEIKDKIKEWQKEDFLGFRTSELYPFLEFEYAKDFIKPEITKEKWGKVIKPTDKNVKKKMINYMEFAWSKANNCRGISSGRSMSHYVAWFWLLGDNVFSDFSDIEDYEYYGKDELVRICEYLGLDSGKWDDGIRSNTEY